MEILYFPLFMVALAGLVLWFWGRTRQHGKAGRLSYREAAEARKGDSGRLVETDRLARTFDRRGPAARKVVDPGPSKSQDMWRSRRQRASHVPGRNALDDDSDVFYAGYLAQGEHHPAARQKDQPLPDQRISESEHVGIDEYLSKKARERARQEAAEQGLTMTAMKYEPADASSEKTGKPGKKRASFKP